jgi:hypothetical protein
MKTSLVRRKGRVQGIIDNIPAGRLPDIVVRTGNIRLFRRQTSGRPRVIQIVECRVQSGLPSRRASYSMFMENTEAIIKKTITLVMISWI